MVAGTLLAKLPHLSQNGDPPPAVEGREVVERRSHRQGVGVVAVVHQDDPVAQLEALATETGEAYARSAVGHLPERHLERDTDRDRGQRVGQVVAARRTGNRRSPRPAGVRDQRLGHPVLDPATRAPPRRLRGRSAGGSGRRRDGARARPPSTGTTATPSPGSAVSSSALAAATAATEPSSSMWTGPTLVITPTSGSAISASSAIWPGAAHRHLQHQQLGVRRRLEHGQRQPDLGVEVLAVGVHPARQQRPGDVLDRGLADRAGDADDPGTPSARRQARGQRLQRRERVLDREDPAPPLGRRLRRARDRAGRRPTPQAPGLERRRRRTRRRRRARRAGRRRGRPPRPRRSRSIARARRARPSPSATTSAPIAAAICSGVEVHHGAAQLRAAPRARPRGRRRGPCGRPRTPGPARGPCRR